MADRRRRAPGEPVADTPLGAALAAHQARWRAAAEGLAPSSRVVLERIWAELCAALAIEAGAASAAGALLERWREAAGALGATPGAELPGLEVLEALLGAADEPPPGSEGAPDGGDDPEALLARHRERLERLERGYLERVADEARVRQLAGLVNALLAAPERR